MERISYNEAVEYIKHWIQFSGCVNDDKFTNVPYSVKSKYKELDDLLDQVVHAGAKTRLTADHADLEKVVREKNIEIALLKKEIEVVYSKTQGEFWYWQNDGFDHLESLTCPILITADDLRNIACKSKYLKEENDGQG